MYIYKYLYIYIYVSVAVLAPPCLPWCIAPQAWRAGVVPRALQAALRVPPSRACGHRSPRSRALGARRRGLAPLRNVLVATRLRWPLRSLFRPGGRWSPRCRRRTWWHACSTVRIAADRCPVRKNAIRARCSASRVGHGTSLPCGRQGSRKRPIFKFYFLNVKKQRIHKNKLGFSFYFIF